MPEKTTAPPVQEMVSVDDIDVVSNPRKHFDEAALEALAESIREHGLVQPILLRPIDGNRFELVAGERRLRAHRLAGLGQVRATVREMSEEDAAELRLIENLHREDLHVLEEADAFRALIDSGRYTPDQLADRCGRSASYIYQRMKMLELTDEAQGAFVEGRIAAGHAIELARLTPDHQAEALEATLRGGAHFAEGDTLSVRALRAWIQRNVHLDLHAAPFKMDDDLLVPEAGPCTTCPKRTGFTPELFPDVEKGETCTDRHCFQAKIAATLERRVAELEAAGEPFVRVAVNRYYISPSEKKKAGVKLDSRDYHEIGGKKDRCEHAVTAVSVYGDRVGEVFEVCAEKRCDMHGQARHQRKKTDVEKALEAWKKERMRRQSAVRRWAADQMLEELDLDVRAPRLRTCRVLALLAVDATGASTRERVAKAHDLEPVGEGYDRWTIPLQEAIADCDNVSMLSRVIMELLLEPRVSSGGSTFDAVVAAAEIPRSGLEARAAREAKTAVPEDLLEGGIAFVRWGERTTTYWDDRTAHAIHGGDGSLTLCKLQPGDEADVDDRWPTLGELCGNCARALLRLQTSASEEGD